MIQKLTDILSVPQWWGERQRRSVILAMKLANMTCMSLINVTTAAALAYRGLFEVSHVAVFFDGALAVEGRFAFV